MKTAEQSSSAKMRLGKFLQDHGFEAIRLIKEKTGHLMINIQLNGVAGTFFLDTGAGITLVEEKQTDKFKLNVLAESDQKAAAAECGGLTVKHSNHNELVINNFRLENVKISVVNLNYINDKLKQLHIPQMDGVIGADLLTLGQAKIDYDSLTLYLNNEKAHAMNNQQ